MSQTVSEMFGYERESDDDKIIDNYDDSSSDISMPSDVTVDSDSDSENDTDNSNNNRQPWPVPVLGNNVFTNELSPIVITLITITCNIIPKPVNVSIMTVFSY